MDPVVREKMRNRLFDTERKPRAKTRNHKLVVVRILTAVLLTCGLVFSTGRPVLAARYDLGSFGLPTITGDVGGSVTGNSSLLSTLTVTVDFGELSPANPNQIVKVVIPIALRTDSAYQLAVTRSGTAPSDPNAIQFSDIGFGIQNLRPYGNKPTDCGDNSNIHSPFNNDPSTTVTVNGATGRAQYPSSLANLGTSTVVMNGPQLSNNFGGSGRNDGWAIDAVLAVKPQYFTPGASNTITLTFVVSAGSLFLCL